MHTRINSIHVNVFTVAVKTYFFQHGSADPHSFWGWNGLVKEVVMGPNEDGGVDFAVADLSITTDRARVVQFSVPFMNLGKRS